MKRLKRRFQPSYKPKKKRSNRREFIMGYAEVYRRRMNPWRKGIRIAAYAVVLAILLYGSIKMLTAQSGLMIGGTIPGVSEEPEVSVSE
jgi:hypothetical protein